MKAATNTFPYGMIPRYLCKIERDAWIRRIIWFLFRRYVLNEDYYCVSRKFTGPRPRGTSPVGTLKVNATAYRYYISKRRTVAFAERMHGEDVSRRMRLDTERAQDYIRSIQAARVA